MSSQEENSLKLTISAILICLVTFLGLISNITGICTIWKIPKQCKLFNNMVICLLAFDCWVLTTAPFFFFGLKHEYFGCKPCAWLVPYWAFPCGHMGTFGTILMTLAISHERYLAIRQPFHYNQSLISESSQRKRLLIYLIPALILSICLNIPRFFNFEVRTNSTAHLMTINLTRLGCNEEYLLYYEFLANTIPFGVIPFLVLIFLSYKTFRNLRCHNIQMKISGINDQKVDKLRRQEEEQMAKVMVGLVVVFLLCHFLRIFLNTWTGIKGARGDIDRCDHQAGTGTLDGYGMAVQLSVFMVMVNSAIGTITYGVINSEFRKHLLCNLKETLRCIIGCKNTSS